MNTTMRSRWAAIGAAIAVTFGAGGIGITHAVTDSGERPIYLPIEPCRLADLRPAPDQVGPRSGPLGAGEQYDLSGWGSVGDCTLPSDTAGLALNVTALGATLPTFLALFPADAADIPNASNLNPVPGQPPTPNAVNVDLDAAGMFSIYNLQGNVNVIIDVVGIYDDHNHDDRYLKQADSIVLMHSTSVIEDHSTGDTVDSVGAGAALKGGYANIGITAPASIGGVQYRLDSIEYCVRAFTGDARITRVNIWREGLEDPNTANDDTTTRSVEGCYTVAGETGDPAFAYDVQWYMGGAGTVRVSGLRSTWVPVT